jgi:predicted phage terminase large subunit-like protein
MNSSPSQQAAAKELLIRRRARNSILHYVNAIDVPGRPIGDDQDGELFEPIETTIAHHHRLLLEKLDEVSKTPHGRMMIFMPPGSAKSTYASVVFPSKYLGEQGGRKLILASYGDDLARKMGRRTRSIIKQRRYAGVWGCGLTVESSAAQEFALTNGSEYMSCGILSGITGNRANGIIIDDPIKGREQANSETVRAKTWDAYEDDLKTRLIPGGWIALIQCMVGDTQVLMADGAEKALRDVRPGDAIATYENGQMSQSVVRNWVNQGPDRVFAIRTSSGKLVKANERHPFLVARNEGLEWVRLRDLVPGDEIIRATATGESTGASIAPLKGAKNQQNARDIAHRITTKCVGQADIDRHPSTLHRDATRTSSTDTASLFPSIADSSICKTGDALCADSRRATMCARIGAESFASIIATNPGKSADCCVTTAISQSDMRELPTSCAKPLHTWSFTRDRIVEIVEDGFEDVFDIQVDRTENFIANGLVSHNTRWHEDDLAGRILPTSWNGESGRILCKDGNEWEVLCLQARCEVDNDPLGRQRGEYLWPEWFDRKHWSQFEQNARTWAALYQQRPTPLDGDLFKPDQISVIDALPEANIQWVRGWDLASTTDGDYTAGVRLGRLPDNRFIIADVVRLRVGPDRRDAALVNTAALDGKKTKQSIPQDPGQAGKTQVLYLTRSLVGYTVITSPETGDKITRAEPVAAQINVGNVSMLRGDWNAAFVSELRVFPNGTNDDQVDALSRAFAELLVSRGAMSLNLRSATN